MKTKFLYLLCCVLSFSAMPLLAQDTATPTPETVAIAAADGLMLKGDLYRPATIPERGATTLLLIHQYDSNRTSYNLVIPQFVEAGYIILTIDLRGHGETGGERDWVKAQDDTQVWLKWLRDQDGVNDTKVAIIGESVGANLAIMGCAQDAQCVTAIAISPGLDYVGLKPQDSLVDGLSSRSALLIASHDDVLDSDASTRTLFAAAKGNVAAEIFAGGSHGEAFFGTARDREATMGLILTWLDQEFAKVKMPRKK